MADFLAALLGWSGLIGLMVATPSAMYAFLASRRDSVGTYWVALLPPLVALLVAATLDWVGVPLSRYTLGAAHTLLALATVIGLRRYTGRATAPAHALSPGADTPVWLAVVLGLLVLPITPLAGIDTYKWQDLASTLSVEGRLAWIEHPLSWFGLTPRAYPPLQPVWLGTAQALVPGLGVEGGFAMISLGTAGLTLLSARALARHLWPRARSRLLFVLLYTLAPLTIRYTHWTTGRGIFLALLPLFVLGLLRLPSWRGAGLTLLSGLLLLLSHRVAVVAVPVTLAVVGLTVLIPRRFRPALGIALFLLGGVLAGLMAKPWGAPFPLGAPLGMARVLTVRYGILVPILAWWIVAGWRTTARSETRLTPAGPLLCLWPFSAMDDPYAALIALPWLVWTATAMLDTGLARWSTAAANRVLFGIIILAILGAAVISVRRSWDAMSWRERTAARFLDRGDPRGPLVIEAPGMARRRMQAYLGGCPRLPATPASAHTINAVFQRPPAGLAPRQLAVAWLRSLRNALDVAAPDYAWYGANPRHYYISIDGHGAAPDGAVTLYERRGVRIMAPAGQTFPVLSPIPSSESPP